MSLLSIPLKKKLAQLFGQGESNKLINILESFLVNTVYKAATVTIGTTPTQVTFSSPLASVNYELIIFDINGIGWKDITDKLATGFKITGLTPGDLIYLAILTS